MNLRHILVFALLFLLSQNVYSDSSWSNFDGWVKDNDVFGPDNDDRNYTFGIAAYWNDEKAKNVPIYWIPKWLKEAVKGKHSEIKVDHFYQLGITNFTPDDIGTAEIVFDDRPYSSLIFSQSDFNSIQRISESTSLSKGASVTVGILGTHAGEFLQNSWHKILRKSSDSDTPVNVEGWNNQINNGFTPTLKFSLSKVFAKYNVFDFIDVAVDGSLDIGYYTMASVGFVAKLNIFQSNRTYYPHQIIRLTTSMGAANRLFDTKVTATDEFFIFFGARKVYVGHNALMECQFKSGEHCLNKSQLEDNFTEMVLGAKTKVSTLFKFVGLNRLGKNYGYLSYSIHRRGAEHKLSRKRTHFWGSLNYEKKF